jgi:hypothetical protein
LIFLIPSNFIPFGFFSHLISFSVAESHGSAPASPIHSPALALPRSLITLGHDGADDDWMPPHSPALTLPRSMEKPSATEKFGFSVGKHDDVPGPANYPALELPRSTGNPEIHNLGGALNSPELKVTHAGLLKSPSSQKSQEIALALRTESGQFKELA